jgi:hypothetical protein
MTLENDVEEVAKAIRSPAVILCDRGTLDGSAYIEPELWERLLQVGHFDGVRRL